MSAWAPDEGRAIVARHRLQLTDKSFVDAIALLNHPGTRTVTSSRDGVVLQCQDPDGFAAAVTAFRGPGWARHALGTVAFKVRSFRSAYPLDEIR